MLQGSFEHIPRPKPCSTTRPLLHHYDAVGNVADDTEIMGDEQKRAMPAPLLDVSRIKRRICAWGGYVERGGSASSATQDRWFERQRPIAIMARLTLTA